MKHLFSLFLHPVCLSFFFGALGVLAFAPFHLYPLIVISMAGLLWVLQKATLAQSFRRGFYYGLGFFGAGVSWVYVSIHQFGGADIFFSILLTLAFISILALFPAAMSWALNRYFPKNTSVKLWLAFPAIWALMEWVRSWIFTGFPWILAGSSQTFWPLKTLAPLGGVYLISFVLAQIAGGIIYYYYASTTYRRYTLAYFCALLLLCTGLNFYHLTHPAGVPFQVSLVQGNITPSVKWLPDEAENTFQQYVTLSENHWDNQLVIWPEAAIPTPLPYSNTLLIQLQQLSRQHHAGLIAGIPYESMNIIEDYNAVIGIGEAKGQYFKRHLVPFGEYFPAPAISKKVLSWLQIPMSNFKPGLVHQRLMEYQNTHIAAFICYEIIFPEEVRNMAQYAGLILSLSDDAWFGHSIAAAQHLQMAQMRALETGRFVLSITNNGRTAIINPEGKIVAALPAYQSGVLTGEVSRYTGETPWLKWGGDLFLLLCIISLIISKVRARRLPDLTPKAD